MGYKKEEREKKKEKEKSNRLVISTRPFIIYKWISVIHQLDIAQGKKNFFVLQQRSF